MIIILKISRRPQRHFCSLVKFRSMSIVTLSPTHQLSPPLGSNMEKRMDHLNHRDQIHSLGTENSIHTGNKKNNSNYLSKNPEMPSYNILGNHKKKMITISLIENGQEHLIRKIQSH